MKFFIAIVATLVCSTNLAFADDTKVEVTSFRYIGDFNNMTAELCGKVTNATNYPVYVKILVDGNTSRPAIYNAIIGPDNVFCTTVITYRGRAELSLW